jgi:hypothetical protein
MKSKTTPPTHSTKAPAGARRSGPGGKRNRVPSVLPFLGRWVRRSGGRKWLGAGGRWAATGEAVPVGRGTRYVHWSVWATGPAGWDRSKSGLRAGGVLAQEDGDGHWGRLEVCARPGGEKRAGHRERVRAGEADEDCHDGGRWVRQHAGASARGWPSKGAELRVGSGDWQEDVEALWSAMRERPACSRGGEHGAVLEVGRPTCLRVVETGVDRRAGWHVSGWVMASPGGRRPAMRRQSGRRGVG